MFSSSFDPPTGVVDRAKFLAIDQFAQRFRNDFKTLRCPCGPCSSSGQGRFKGMFINGINGINGFVLYNRSECQSMHQMIPWAAQARFAYLSDLKFTFTSGCPCSLKTFARQ